MPRKYLLIFISVTLCLLWTLALFIRNRPDPESTLYIDFDQESSGEIKNYKVVLGIVSCGDGSNGTVYLDQTAVLLKSVMISAEIYKAGEIEIHHFLERAGDNEKFQRLFREMGYKSDDGSEVDSGGMMGAVKLKWVAHSLKEVNIPKAFEQFMIYNSRFRCGFVRFYFPKALPDVDALIYMDADTLVTGNLTNIWSQFSKLSTRMIGLVNDREPENYQFTGVSWTLSDVPLLTKKGYNSGVLWMNLTRMRAFGWEERFSRLYQDYSKIVKYPVDQTILNILVYFNPSLVVTLPCTFNFAHTACSKGLFCKAAEEDPFGVQIVHGYGRKFQLNKALYRVYKQYRDFPFSRKNFTMEAFKTEVMEPIRKWYEASNWNATDSNTTGKCRGILNWLMFSNHFK